MSGKGEAWVWSQYRGVAGDVEKENPGPLPLFDATTGPGSSKRTSWGVAFALAMGLGLFFPKIAFLLLILAVMMIASGMAPERFDEFCSSLPGGNLILRLLSFVETLLP
jgi:hypothetical protein